MAPALAAVLDDETAQEEETRLVAEEAAADAEGAAGDGGGEPPEPDPLLIDIGGQLSMIPGGKKATSSTLRIVGGKFEVAGELKKGQTIEVTLTVQVGAVEFVDIKDATTGQVVACERRHKGRPVAVAIA